MPTTQTPDDQITTERTTLLAVAPRAIATREDYDSGVTYLADLRTYRAKVIKWFKPLKDAANKAVQSIRDREKDVLSPVNDEEARVERALADFVLAERKRLEEAAAAQREADERLAADLANDAAEQQSVAGVLDEIHDLAPLPAPTTNQAFSTSAASVSDDLVVTITNANALIASIVTRHQNLLTQGILKVNEGVLKRYVKGCRMAGVPVTLDGITVTDDVTFRRSR